LDYGLWCSCDLHCWLAFSGWFPRNWKLRDGYIFDLVMFSFPVFRVLAQQPESPAVPIFSNSCFWSLCPQLLLVFSAERSWSFTKQFTQKFFFSNLDKWSTVLKERYECGSASKEISRNLFIDNWIVCLCVSLVGSVYSTSEGRSIFCFHISGYASIWGK